MHITRMTFRDSPREELPEEHGGELVGTAVSVLTVSRVQRELGRRRWRTWRCIVADPFVYILEVYPGRRNPGISFGAGVGFSMLSFGILPLVLFLFSLWAVINFFAVVVKSW